MLVKTRLILWTLFIINVNIEIATKKFFNHLETVEFDGTLYSQLSMIHYYQYKGNISSFSSNSEVIVSIFTNFFHVSICNYYNSVLPFVKKVNTG